MNKIFTSIKKLIKALVLWLYKLFIKSLPIDSKAIIFESNVGRSYSGNPKAIYEEMIKQGLDSQYRCYYILEDTKMTIPGPAKR